MGVREKGFALVSGLFLVSLFLLISQLQDEVSHSPDPLGPTPLAQCRSDLNALTDDIAQLRATIVSLTTQLSSKEKELTELEIDFTSRLAERDKSIDELHKKIRQANHNQALQAHSQVIQGHAPSSVTRIGLADIPAEPSVPGLVSLQRYLRSSRQPLSQHHLSIIVPFRKADEELQEFVPHMHSYLAKKNINFDIVIVNQMDTYRFNRGLLLNIGFLHTVETSDYFAMHDVDLLPLNNDLPYDYAMDPTHVAAPWLHPIYHYKNFIGGIFLMNREDFLRVNGLSVNFWGWGKEDDEFYNRIIENGLKIVRPGNLTTGQDNTFRHVHDQEKRVRDMMKVGDQYDVGNKRDNRTGIATMDGTYKLVSTRKENVKGLGYTVLDVELICNTNLTPWCVPPDKCKPGYYRHEPSHICRRCGRNCWKGFVLAGECTETTNKYCLKIGRDISEEEAKKWPMGTMDPPPGHEG